MRSESQSGKFGKQEPRILTPEPARTLVIMESVTGLRRGGTDRPESGQMSISRRPIPLTWAPAVVLEAWKQQTSYIKPFRWGTLVRDWDSADCNPTWAPERSSTYAATRIEKGRRFNH